MLLKPTTMLLNMHILASWTSIVVIIFLEKKE